MKHRFSVFAVLSVLLCAGALTYLSQTPASSAEDVLKPAQVVDRFIQRERAFVRSLAQFTPLVETYIQNLQPNNDLGTVPANDKYFLAKLDLKHGVKDNSFLPVPGFVNKARQVLTSIFFVEYLPGGFANMILIDEKNFDRTTYDFTYVRREFLGEVRCFVFDVKPKGDGGKPKFIGRVWVEDRDFNIVRFNGTYTPSMGADKYFHFDSWRENLAPGLWLPSYIYTEESDFPYFMSAKKLRFKAQTRLWGYNASQANNQEEFTSLTVEPDRVQDNVDSTENPTPLQNLRSWERQAEDNALKRLQGTGLLAAEGPVDKVLETVLNNLEVTNNLNIDPGIRARVLLTTPLESFAVGHTVVLSRGLIDVLPDEASLASVLAHELAHISLGHQFDTRYAFSDRLLFNDEETFDRLNLKRTESEETQADAKATEFMKASPYKDQLGNAGLFLRALQSRAAKLPNLLRPTLGNAIAERGKIRRMAELIPGAPALQASKTDQIAALPLGSRLHINPWNNRVDLIQAKPLPLISAKEKMPFEVAPVFLYLKYQKTVDGTAETVSK
jgi:hypothetical protein